MYASTIVKCLHNGGVIFQILGLMIAVCGVHQAYKGIYGQNVASAILLPLFRLYARARRRLPFLKSRRRKPPSGHFVIDDSIAIDTSGFSEPNRWALEERMSRIENTLIPELEKRVMHKLDRTTTELATRIGADLTQVQEIAQATHTATIGPGGRGLRHTFYGLSLSLIGLCLTEIPPLLGF